MAVGAVGAVAAAEDVIEVETKVVAGDMKVVAVVAVEAAVVVEAVVVVEAAVVALKHAGLLASCSCLVYWLE